ncbi:MAG: hypothetical protein AB8H86_03410 [Polyangiales bacterium]
MTRPTTYSLLALCLFGGCVLDDDSPQCDVDTPCPTDFICQAGLCIFGCPSGTQNVGGACEAIPPECVTGADCPGNICDEGRCRTCRADVDCGEEVCVAGNCQAPCADNSECAAGEVCHRGACGVTCADDPRVCDDFFYAQLERASEWERISPRYARLGCQMSSEAIVDPLCDGALPHSRQPEEYCDSCLASLGGCGSGQTCENGDCTCAANEDCPGALVCVDGFCAPCVVDAECGCDMYCSSGTCHERCEADDECPDSFVCAGGRCAGCQSDTDCNPGERCFEDGCVEPCSSTSEACTVTGRSSVCETYELIDELVVPACM